MNSEKALINNIILIKKAIGEIIRDRLYIKNFSNKIIELLYELDDYSPMIGVEVIQKTELHKCLRPLLGYSDAYSELKEICQNFLESIMKNIKHELFINSETDFCENVAECDFDTEALFNELQIQINRNNEEEENEECIIRTDEKYLEAIKKNENNMLLETKRRIKVKRGEVADKIRLEYNNKLNKRDDDNNNNKINEPIKATSNKNKLERQKSFNANDDHRVKEIKIKFKKKKKEISKKKEYYGDNDSDTCNNNKCLSKKTQRNKDNKVSIKIKRSRGFNKMNKTKQGNVKLKCRK